MLSENKTRLAVVLPFTQKTPPLSHDTDILKAYMRLSSEQRQLILNIALSFLGGSVGVSK